jgi:predicted acetyltransferase
VTARAASVCAHVHCPNDVFFFLVLKKYKEKGKGKGIKNIFLKKKKSTATYKEPNSSTMQ